MYYKKTMHNTYAWLPTVTSNDSISTIVTDNHLKGYFKVNTGYGAQICRRQASRTEEQSSNPARVKPITYKIDIYDYLA